MQNTKDILKFVKSKKDLRSVNIELEDITIKEFKEWCIERGKWFKISSSNFRVKYHLLDLFLTFLFTVNT